MYYLIIEKIKHELLLKVESLRKRFVNTVMLNHDKDELHQSILSLREWALSEYPLYIKDVTYTNDNGIIDIYVIPKKYEYLNVKFTCSIEGKNENDKN